MDRSSDQRDKFEQAARELECDDDPKRFRERVGKLVKHKPVTKPESPEPPAVGAILGTKSLI